MDKDLLLKRYYADNDRYADLINGLTFEGKQILHGSDLQELDSRIISYPDIPFVRGEKTETLSEGPPSASILPSSALRTRKRLTIPSLCEI